MPESGLFKFREAFEPVGVDRRAGNYIVLDEPNKSDTPEIRDDLHPYASRGLSPSLYRDHDEGRFPAFQLTASLQTGLSPANPGIVYFHVAAQRLAFQVHHRSAELVEHHPRCLVKSQAELALQEKR